MTCHLSSREEEGQAVQEQWPAHQQSGDRCLTAGLHIPRPSREVPSRSTLYTLWCTYDIRHLFRCCRPLSTQAVVAMLQYPNTVRAQLIPDPRLGHVRSNNRKVGSLQPSIGDSMQGCYVWEPHLQAGAHKGRSCLISNCTPPNGAQTSSLCTSGIRPIWMHSLFGGHLSAKVLPT